MKSAVCLMNASLTPHPTAFQSLKPIGGVSANPLSSATAVGAVTRAATASVATDSAAMATRIMTTPDVPGREHHCPVPFDTRSTKSSGQWPATNLYIGAASANTEYRSDV